MTKFYKRLRHELMNQSKTLNYLKYALGEVFLVVIGILVALQINNWNEAKKESKREIALLQNLRNDINSDITSLNSEDSIYQLLETDAEIAIELFYKANTTREMESVANLAEGLWDELYINTNTHNEMINSGNMYGMKNKDLQKQITAYYLIVEADKNYIREVNKEQAYLYNTTPDFFPFKFLSRRFKNAQIKRDLMDTTWMSNPNSPTYLAVGNYLESNLNTNNIYRRTVFKRTKEGAEKLLTEINKELKIRNN